MQQPIVWCISASRYSSRAGEILSMKCPPFVLSCFRGHSVNHQPAPSKCVYVCRVSVRVDGRRGIAVGPEDLRPGGPITIDDLGRGMTEYVASTDADDRDARRQRTDERFGA